MDFVQLESELEELTRIDSKDIVTSCADAKLPGPNFDLMKYWGEIPPMEDDFQFDFEVDEFDTCPETSSGGDHPLDSMSGLCLHASSIPFQTSTTTTTKFSMGTAVINVSIDHNGESEQEVQRFINAASDSAARLAVSARTGWA